MEKIYLTDTILLYEGEMMFGKPYGYGKVYYSTGRVYQEGIFDVKGLVEGKEYYPNGNVRFEGKYQICSGYGPNYPDKGKVYNESGELIYDGEVVCRLGGVGYPTVVEPEGYGPVVQKKHPNIQYFMWEDRDRMNEEGGQRYEEMKGE